MLLETPLGEESLDSAHGPSRLCSYTRSLLWFPLSPSAQIHLPGMLHDSACLVPASPHFLYILEVFFSVLCSLYHQPITIFTLDDFKSYFLPKPFSNNFPSILNDLPSIALPLTDIYYTQSIGDKNITLPIAFCQPEETKEQVSLLHSCASSFSGHIRLLADQPCSVQTLPFPHHRSQIASSCFQPFVLLAESVS